MTAHKVGYDITLLQKEGKQEGNSSFRNYLSTQAIVWISAAVTASYVVSQAYLILTK